MAEDTEVDLVAQLSDEVLMEIIGHLPSLRDKLRLESVNTRFQRCLLELLRTRPIPFVYNVNRGNKRLNGHYLRTPFPEVLASLGKKAKFNSIDIVVRNAVDLKELDSVLAALVTSDIDCLDKVTAFKVLSPDCGCSETLLEDFLAKCTKLSEVRLDFDVSQNHEPFSNPVSFPLKLGVVLKEKALTELSANLHSYPQEQVIQMFQSIKPNTLKKIDLRIRKTALNMNVLVTELCGGGWSALEEMDIHWIVRNMSVDALFSSLTRLPKLRKCKFVLVDKRDIDQLVPALTSLAAGLTFLFANHAEITVHYDIRIRSRTHLTGCQYVALIRQVQVVHPYLEVGFGPNGRFLTLTLGKVCFQLQHSGYYETEPCDNADCPECAIFYPTLLSRIMSEAIGLSNGVQHGVHLANARLDRCRIDSVVDHLARRWFGDQGCKALLARINEARNLATITFERRSWSPRHDQFMITVDCGSCLSNSCFGCL